jgi:hypothetical protein
MWVVGSGTRPALLLRNSHAQLTSILLEDFFLTYSFADFYLQPAPRLRHNTLRGLFTIKTNMAPFSTTYS